MRLFITKGNQTQLKTPANIILSAAQIMIDSVLFF